MTQALKILNLGDDPCDTESIASALEEAGISCDTCRGAPLDELTCATKQGGVDIIFTDRTLPGFNGVTARAIVKKRSSEYTVMCTSGTGRENNE